MPLRAKFNRLFKETHRRRGFEGTVKATWINIAFSYQGLKKLVHAEADEFADASFRQGLAARSAALSDPTSEAAEGSAVNWMIGGPDNEADIVLIVAADDEHDLLDAAQYVENGIYASEWDSAHSSRGVHVMFKQRGESQNGHEHFGWLDGVSQPGLRGRLSHVPGDVLTPRRNAANPDQGLPGQDLLWPGEFIFGYKGQDRNKDVAFAGLDSLRPAGRLVAPEWAQDGSYLVFRRLRQDVGAFHRFLHHEGDRLNVRPEVLGARLVGRWTSGAPLMRAPISDNVTIGKNECARNNFEYDKPSKPSVGRKRGECNDKVCPPSLGDPDGVLCPFSAHIRKAYPRDETVCQNDTDPYEGLRPKRTLGESDTQTHRLLRRGIPYGPASNSTPQEPIADDVDRGLLFMAYMTSMTDQFEFVTKHWLNDPDFKKTSTGVDPILGEVRANTSRTISTVLPGQQASVEINLQDWVIATGGGYFFAPSIRALKHLSDPAH